MGRKTSERMSEFREARRRDRIWDEAEARRLLARGEYGFLAMNGIDGYGYGVPLSYVYAGDRIYFHCAPQGYKLECLAADARVCFCVVGHTRVVPEDFTTAYESAMAFGRVVCGLSDAEKAEALDGLVRKYSPDHLVRSKTYIARSFARTNVLRLDIEHVAGKCKRMKGYDDEKNRTDGNRR